MMKIKSITIELELEADDLRDHATVIQFRNGMWSANCPFYSRIGNMQHEIWKLIKSHAVQPKNPTEQPAPQKRYEHDPASH